MHVYRTIQKLNPNVNLKYEILSCLKYYVAACSTIIISPTHAPTVMIIASLHGRIQGQLKWHLAW